MVVVSNMFEGKWNSLFALFSKGMDPKEQLRNFVR